MQKKMSRREFLKASAATGAILSMARSITLAEEPKSDSTSGASTGLAVLDAVIVEKKSSRQFSPEPLPIELLSNLLWAGFVIAS